MRAKQNAVTELPLSPDQERHSRMIRYTVAMTIRVICFGLAIVIPDWWRIIPIVGAVVLPYFAVVIANNVDRSAGARVERPGGLERRS